MRENNFYIVKMEIPRTDVVPEGARPSYFILFSKFTKNIIHLMEKIYTHAKVYIHMHEHMLN